MAIERFAGPLFLVGMPRSGTKLLRDMLGQSRAIRFARVETEFLPYWVKTWHDIGSIADREQFSTFAKKCRKLPFFVEYAAKDVQLDVDDWWRRCETFSTSDVFESLLKSVLKISSNDAHTIWADKSPSYVRHLPLLKSQFHSARFIHIVRDVRDCCLSSKNAWGKNIFRTAQRWNDDVLKCHRDGSRFPRDYFVIRYEDLLADPQRQIQKICSFLRVPYSDEMLRPNLNTENLGEAKGVDGILAGNVAKYREKMTPKTILRIESIAAEGLRTFDYPCEWPSEPTRVSAFRMRYLQLLDGIKMISHNVLKRGVLQGVKYVVNDYRVSGNRRSD